MVFSSTFCYPLQDLKLTWTANIHGRRWISVNIFNSEGGIELKYALIRKLKVCKDTPSLQPSASVEPNNVKSWLQIISYNFINYGWKSSLLIIEKKKSIRIDTPFWTPII